MPRLALAEDLSLARQLISWQDPPAWSAAAVNDAPPGRGNFIIKIGGRPAIPFRVTLTHAEQALHDTKQALARTEPPRRATVRDRRDRRGGGGTAGMRQADRHAGGPSTFSPLLAGTLADGRTRWPPAGTPILIATACAGAVIVVGVVVARARRRSAGTRADRAARLLATGRNVHPVSRANAQATAERFGVEQPGLPIARAVADGQTLYATWEDMQCDI